MTASHQGDLFVEPLPGSPASMPSIGEKVHYVLRARQSRAHECHWPGCAKQVPPAKWGCSEHWFALPKHLRDRIWATYRPGQEITRTPSREYLEVARQVQEWIAAHGTDGAAIRLQGGSR